MQLYIQLNAPHMWAVVSRDGSVVEHGTSETLSVEEVSSRYNQVIGVVPGEQVLSRSVTLPATNRKKATAAIPYALEDSLSSDVDDLYFSVMKWESDGSAKVSVVDRSVMQDWLTQAQDAGLRLDAMIPDYLLLPLHPQASMTIARDIHGDINIRSDDTVGLKLDPESFGIWWIELEDKDAALAVNEKAIAKQLVAHHKGPVSEWAVGNNFIAWMENSGSPPPGFNLLQGEFAPNHQIEGAGLLRWAAVVFGIALALKVGADGAEFFWLSQQDARLDQRIQAQFEAAFPGAGPSRFPREEMENRITAMQSNTGGGGIFQYLLSAVSQAVSNGQGQVEEVSFKDNALIVTCTTGNFVGLDQLKNAFEQIPNVTAELLSSGSRDDRVNSRFRLQRSAG